MATPFRNILDFFNNIGVFDVVLPFLLVFTIVFALLERTKVLGVEVIEGKKYTKKNLNSLAALVIALLVIASSHLVQIITQVSSQFVVLLFLIVLFLLLVGSFFQEKQEAVFLEGTWKTVFMIIIFIGLAFIFLDSLDLLDSTLGFLQGTDKGEITGSAILLILIIMFMVFVTKERHPQEKH